MKILSTPGAIRFIGFYIDQIVIGIILLLAYYLGIEHLELAVLVIHFAYYIPLEFFLGKSIGKYITGQEVVFEADVGNKIYHIAVRTLVRLVPFEMFSYFLNGNRVMWHDKLSGTRVVNSRR